ncbi:SPASM domain-containing protein [Thermodesulfobacteriota bacterium]
MNPPLDSTIGDLAGIFPNTPLEAHFQISWKCDFGCNHCPYFFSGKEPENQPEIIRRVLAVLAQHDIRHVLFIAPDIDCVRWLPEVIGETRAMGLDCELLTGGPMPSAGIWGEFERAGLRNVVFELFGDRVFHDRLTLAGSFDRICSSMVHAMTAGLDVAAVWWLLAGCDVEPAGFARLLPAGLRGLVMQYFIPFKPGQHDFALEESEALYLWRRARETVDSLPFRYSSCGRHPDRDIVKLCSAGRFKLSVGPDGTIRPCEHFKPVPASTLGNLLAGDLEEIWASPILTRIRRQVPGTYQGPCGTCEDQWNCSACRAVGFNFRDNVEAGVPACRFWEQTILEG